MGPTQDVFFEELKKIKKITHACHSQSTSQKAPPRSRIAFAGPAIAVNKMAVVPLGHPRGGGHCGGHTGASGVGRVLRAAPLRGPRHAPTAGRPPATVPTPHPGRPAGTRTKPEDRLTATREGVVAGFGGCLGAVLSETHFFETSVWEVICFGQLPNYGPARPVQV